MLTFLKFEFTSASVYTPLVCLILSRALVISIAGCCNERLHLFWTFYFIFLSHIPTRILSFFSRRERIVLSPENRWILLRSRHFFQSTRKYGVICRMSCTNRSFHRCKLFPINRMHPLYVLIVLNYFFNWKTKQRIVFLPQLW